jgi:predicted small lipoprotein YifL
MRPRSLVFELTVLAIAALLAGCGSSGPSRSPTAAANPNAPESLPPGDIPDTVAYVPYAVPGAGYTVSTPEGWSRTRSAGVVVFTDKLNRVEIAAAPARGPVTVASVTAAVVPRLAAAVKGFRLQSVAAVTRTSGPAIRTAYLAYSPADPVTGKFGVLAVERYDFLHRGRDVVLTLSAPNGSDNVDPWRKVTDSLAFSR